MRKDNCLKTLLFVVFLATIVVGCVEKEAPATNPTPTTQTPTPTPTPPLNYDSSAVKTVDINIEPGPVSGDESLFAQLIDMPITSLFFYDEYGRKITKFDNGDTTIIVGLLNSQEAPLDTYSIVTPKNETLKLPWIVYGKQSAARCYYIAVAVLLPDGRVANSIIPFDYDIEINTKQYVVGYADGEADASKGYSIHVSSSADTNYRDGYYDGYGGYTPRATYLNVGEYETIQLSPSIPEQSRSWHPVTAFSGKAMSFSDEDKITSSFNIQGEVWRVTYTVSDTDPKTGYFHTAVYPKGETVGSVADASCDDTPCSDTFYIFKKTGDYYFTVSALYLDNWKLEVEDYY